MAKMGGTGVIDIVAKMGGAHCGKNGWNSLWQEWVELTVAKMGGICVIDIRFEKSTLPLAVSDIRYKKEVQ